MMISKSKITSKPLIGGILMMISGSLGILGTISYWIGFGEAGSGFGKGDMPPFVPSIIFGLPIPALFIALFDLVGSIFAISRRKWALSLICAIAAALSLILLGIPAIVLIALSKDEVR
jgi:hypothetical protein